MKVFIAVFLLAAVFVSAESGHPNCYTSHDLDNQEDGSWPNPGSISNFNIPDSFGHQGEHQHSKSHKKHAH
ncbi:unnamed protein product [Leptidea sinapis]|uniref:Uncharacterized protein n=1 Tax=Leptidea sinapis TaxID=189913 RepID=A0A5E4QVC3_9NEOP|nr:unnamed protein product [Leptidea sinapis]